jgi:hypothetical protein
LNAATKRGLLALGMPWAAGPRLALALAGLDSPGSGRLSVGAWLRACGQGPEAMDQVWEPMVLAALNARADEARLTEFLAVLGQGFLRGGRTAALGRSGLPLSQLLAPVGDWLEARGSALRLSAAVRRAEPQPGGWRLTLADGPLEAARLVLALPPARVASALGAHGAGLGLECEAGRPRSPIVSVYTLSDGPLLPAPMVAFGPQGPGRQAAFHWGFSRPSALGWISSFTASAAEGLAGQENAALLQGLASLLAGRGRPYQWRAARVVREKAATPRFEPGSAPRLAQRTALPGLALAGDWTDTGLPATIEGAVRSGEAAVKALA